MTTAHTGRETTTDGDATAEIVVPSPPPRPVQEEDKENFDPVFGGMIQKLWDATMVYGPISRTDLRNSIVSSNHSWREYLRFHPHVSRTKSPTEAETNTADRWMINRDIDHALERGWLTPDADDADKLVVGTLPPGHKPLQTMGGESDLRARLLGMTNVTARRILEAKVSSARMKPTRAGKNRLRKSIEAYGLLSPIVAWEIPGEPLIIDGVTRSEICAELGIELEPHNPAHYRYLPRETTATEALFQRIQFEIAATTKDHSDEARNEYIAGLSKDGWKNEAIAKEVGITERHVRRILSQADTYVREGQKTPSDVDVAEFIALSNGGWTVRDIAERTQWSKSAVQRAMTSPEAPAADTVPATKELPPTKMVLIKALYELGEGTTNEIYDNAGVTARSGGRLSELKRTGYIRISSGSAKSRKDPAKFVLTDKALTELAPFLTDRAPSEPELESGPEPDDSEPLATVTPLHTDTTLAAPDPEPTPRKPRAPRGGRTLAVAAAAVDKLLRGGGFTREQLIEYWSEHPVPGSDA